MDALAEYREHFGQIHGPLTNIAQEVETEYQQARRAREAALLDLAASVAAVGEIVRRPDFRIDDLHPQMLEAWDLAYPGAHLHSSTDWTRVLPKWKASYFDILVRDKLNQGEWVGDVLLDVSQQATIADAASQLSIVSAFDDLADRVAMAGLTAIRWLRDELANHDNVVVPGAEQAAYHAATLMSDLMNSGAGPEALSAHFAHPAATHASNLDAVHDWLPLLPVILIVSTEGHRVLVGRKSFEDGFAAAAERLGKAATVMAVGWIVHFLDGGLISFPACMATRFAWDRVADARRMNRYLRNKSGELEPMIAFARQAA